MQTLSNAKNLQESDSALMMSFAAGDREGFELLYRRHSASIYRFFYFGTHADQALATELYYDVWMTVVRGRMRYSNDINFTDWLYHSAWARLHDHLRLHSLELDLDSLKPASKKSTVVSMAGFMSDDSSQSADAAKSSKIGSTPSTAAVEQEKSLVDAIQNLSPEQKEVVLLKFCFSMSNQDISDFIDVSKPTVDRITRESAVLLRAKVATPHVEGDQFNG